MEFIRRNTDYALRALVRLANNPTEDAVSVRTIAKEERVSEDFLRKVFQVLAERDIVESQRGPKGGFSLARGPESISVREVVEALQGPIAINRCFLGKESCPNFDQCTLKDKLAGLQQKISSFFEDVTIADLLTAVEAVPAKTKSP